MARYRTIAVNFWNDPYIEGLSHYTKYLYIYLITTCNSNIGLMDITSRRIGFDLDISVEEVDTALKQLEADDRILRDGTTIWLTRFIKHQMSDSPKVRKSLANDLNCIATSPMYHNILARYDYLAPDQMGIDTQEQPHEPLSIPSAHPTDTLSVPYHSIGIGKGIGNGKDKKHMSDSGVVSEETSEEFQLTTSDPQPKKTKTKAAYTPEFEEFWKAYPSYGRNKAGAFQKWQAALAGTGRSCRASPEQLVRAAKRYAEECREKGTEKGFVLHAATFLGPNERWKEYDRPQTCMSGALRDDVRRMDFTREGVFDAVGFERARRGLDPYEPGCPYRPPVPGSQLGG